MINLINKQQCGLIAWGTKRGKQVFFAHNVQGDLGDIDNALSDVRIPVQVQEPNLSFYSIDHNPSYAIVTMYRSIYDWLNRSGYFAISLVFPGNTVFKEDDQLFPLLKSLTDLYFKEYIAPNPKLNQILDIREDIKLFSEALKISDFELVQEPGDRSGKYQDRCLIQYQDDDHLANILQYFRRDELKNFGQIFVLPANDARLHCSYPRIELKPVEQTIKLIITVVDKDNNRIPNVKYQFEKSNIFSPHSQLRNAENGIIELDQLTEKDTVTLLIQNPRYETQDLTALLRSGWHSYFDNTRRKVVELSVTLKPQPPKQEPYTKPRTNGGGIPGGKVMGGGEPPKWEPTIVFPPTTPPTDRGRNRGQGLNPKVWISIGAILVLLVLLVAVWWSFFSCEKLEYDYVSKIDTIKSSTADKNRDDWNNNLFIANMDSIREINNRIESDLKRKDLCDEEKFKLDRYKNNVLEIKNAYAVKSKSKLEIHINKIIIDDKFNPDEAKKVKEIFKDLNIDISNSSKVDNYLNVCKHIDLAKRAINGDRAPDIDVVEIFDALVWILNSKNTNCKFLTDEQRLSIEEYQKIIVVMKDNPNIKDGEGVLKWMVKKNKESKRITEVTNFMNKNGLKTGN